ncbi:MAG: membrane dipeptidase [Desulfofustis sp. PB-SRB1]|nr:membrane dipeptidase [Desulfofustis sp. PB-SRB1]
MKTNVTERVATLHRKSFIIDAHFDLPLDVAMRRERGERRVIETSYIEDFRAGGVDLVVGAIFIHDYFLPEMGLRRALDQITYIHEELEESPGADETLPHHGRGSGGPRGGGGGLDFIT